MISLIKEQLAIRRLKKNLHVHVRPDRAFLKSARTRFITLAQQQAGVRVGAIGYFRSFKYATVAIAVVFALTSGMAVFADANNVPANHPLYGFKRLSEQVRLDLSSPVQQVELHKTFAQRRLKEISELKTEQQIEQQTSPSPEISSRTNKENDQKTNRVIVPTINPTISPNTDAESNRRTNEGDNSGTSKLQDRIDGLNKDFQDETDHVLDQDKNPQIKTEARVQFCQDILNTIKDKSESDRLPTQMVDHIKSRCGENRNSQED